MLRLVTRVVLMLLVLADVAIAWGFLRHFGAHAESPGEAIAWIAFMVFGVVALGVALPAFSVAVAPKQMLRKGFGIVAGMTGVIAALPVLILVGPGLVKKLTEEPRSNAVCFPPDAPLHRSVDELLAQMEQMQRCP